jgi:hypothetical protein
VGTGSASRAWPEHGLGLITAPLTLLGLLPRAVWALAKRLAHKIVSFLFPSTVLAISTSTSIRKFHSVSEQIAYAPPVPCSCSAARAQSPARSGTAGTTDQRATDHRPPTTTPDHDHTAAGPGPRAGGHRPHVHTARRALVATRNSRSLCLARVPGGPSSIISWGARWTPLVRKSQVPSNVIKRAHPTRLGRPLGP